MNKDFRYFPYIIRDIVSEVRNTFDFENKTFPVFEFGTYLELVKQITIKSNNDMDKYPLFWLVWEANDSLQDWTSKVSYSVSPRIFIANHTSTEYTSTERYEANFLGQLFPIWEIFKEYLEYSTFVSNKGAFNFKLAEHLLWGESMGFQKNKNVLFDTLDSIEVKFNNLEINKICKI